MYCFEKLTERIYRLKVPFENIYTAVFLVSHKDGRALVDCATTREDAENIILPAISELGIDKREITHILITHAHGDHAGGLRYIIPHLPEAVVCSGSNFVKERLDPPHFVCLTDGQIITDGITAVSLPGHSVDMLGYLDTESMTLISGDAVQLCGVGRYGCGLGSFDSYFSSLDKLSEMKLERLIASHDYYPHGSTAEGREEVERYLGDSRRYAEYISETCKKCADEGVTDKTAVCDLIKEKNALVDSLIPPLQYSTVDNCLKKYR